MRRPVRVSSVFKSICESAISEIRFPVVPIGIKISFAFLGGVTALDAKDWRNRVSARKRAKTFFISVSG
jgi:hypothetical protein